FRSAAITGRTGAVRHSRLRDRPGAVFTRGVDGTDPFEDARVLLTPEGEDRIDAAAFDIDVHALPRAQLIEQDALGELVLDLLLNGATQGACTQHRIVAALRQQLLGRVGQVDGHALSGQTRVQTL